MRASVLDLLCGICAVPLSPALPPFDPAKLDSGAPGLWRYGRALHLDGTVLPPISLGEGGTPLLDGGAAGSGALFKLEFIQPTGSYKDRGSSVLATALSRYGADAVAEDSSGNAGASLAAYLSRAGIRMRLYTPESAAPGAIRQARAYGAEVDSSAATRSLAAELAREAPAPYLLVSHALSPYFLAGVATLAFELWEGLDRSAPESIVTPLGQGILVLGLYYGFRSLQEAGFIATLPRLYGVQAAGCAPFARAFRAGADLVAAVDAGPSIARGVAVAEPARGAEVLAAVRATGGAVLTVTDDEIEGATAALARMGWYVEPTGAVGMAGLSRLADIGEATAGAVVPLTGSGLKAW
jgi:threonine synthase